MTTDALIQAGIDFEGGLERFSGRTDIYVKYLKKFPEDQCYPAMLEALEKGDIEEAFSNAHSLKGTSGNLSLTRFYDSLFTLVEALREKNLEKARELLPAVQEAYDVTVKALTSGALDE